MISIVIPTYNEAAVIEETLRRAAAALRILGEDFELIIVDDSSADGTAERVEALQKELPVRVLRRPGRLGLATAVLDGWAIARGDKLGAMDADLQHPPEVLAALAAALANSDTDLAIASRYISGGGTTDWSLLRRFISWGATHMAATVLPRTLAGVSDPMSGMFLVRASALKDVQLDPVGYKILLEVLAKARHRSQVEVPYHFEQRGRGASKLGARQYGEYLVHLFRLARSTGQLGAWMRYCLVGLVGAVVNLVALEFLFQNAGWPLVLAVPVAIQLALLSNFSWNDSVTFSSLRKVPRRDAGFFCRLLLYEKKCAPAAILNALLTLALARLGIEVRLAAVVGIVGGGLWNLLFNIPNIWQVWEERPLREIPSETRPPSGGR